MAIKVSSNNAEFDSDYYTPGVVVDDDGNVYVRDISAVEGFLKSTPNQYGHTYAFVFANINMPYSANNFGSYTQIERFPFAMSSGTSTLIASSVPNIDKAVATGISSEFFGPGVGTVYNDYDNPTFGPATDMAYLPLNSVGVFNSPVAGYISGGSGSKGGSLSPLYQFSSNTVQKFVYASDTDVTTVGEVGDGVHAASYSSPTHGYFVSGSTLSPLPYVNYKFWHSSHIQSDTKYKFSFASEGSAASVADMSVAAGTPSSNVSTYVSSPNPYGFSPSSWGTLFTTRDVDNRGLFLSVLINISPSENQAFIEGITVNPTYANNAVIYKASPANRGFYSETHAYRNGMTKFAREVIGYYNATEATYYSPDTSPLGYNREIGRMLNVAVSGADYIIDPKATSVPGTTVNSGANWLSTPYYYGVMLDNHHETSIEKFPFAVDDASYTLVASPATGRRGNSMATTQSASDGWMLGQALAYNPNFFEPPPVVYYPNDVIDYYQTSAASQKLPFANDTEVVATVANLIYPQPYGSTNDALGVGSVTTNGDYAFIGNIRTMSYSPSTPVWPSVSHLVVSKYPFSSTAGIEDVGSLLDNRAGTALHF